jgi:hypothetical protein
MTTDPMAQLSELLSGTLAEPVITKNRIAPSTVYDFQYRAIMVTAGFFILRQRSAGDGSRVRAAELKLAQFVAMRPWLLTVLQEWSASQKHPQASLLTSERLRRGFVGDAMHDRTVEFLTVRGVLNRTDTHVIAGPNVRVAESWYSEIVTAEIFIRERATFAAVGDVTITERMLEGWRSASRSLRSAVSPIAAPLAAG